MIDKSALEVPPPSYNAQGPAGAPESRGFPRYSINQAQVPDVPVPQAMLPNQDLAAIGKEYQDQREFVLTRSCDKCI
jgi:hypothetical protein